MKELALAGYVGNIVVTEQNDNITVIFYNAGLRLKFYRLNPALLIVSLL